MRYELFYLIGASKEAEVARIKEEIQKMIEELGGVFEKKETQEKRRLAYDIKHEGHGIYIAQRFELSSTEKLEEIKNKLNLNQDIFRFMISRADELPELTTKEERENQTKKEEKEIQERTSEQAPTKKETLAPEKSRAKETAPIPESKEEKEEDIDKKLEEILNI